MSKSEKVNTFLIPEDKPPERKKLKRIILFFNSVSLISPEDKALINDGEVIEKFPNMEIRWSQRAIFPKSEDYDSTFNDIVSETKKLQKKQIIRILKPNANHVIDPGVNWSLYHSAISLPDLVKNAVPDCHKGEPNVKISDGVIYGGEIMQSGYKSKYETNFNAPYTIENVDKKWTTLSHLRIARTIKSIRRAYGENLYPVSLDSINENILSFLLSIDIDKDKNPNYNNLNFDMSLDIVNPLELESELDNMSWSEVYELRKHILPKLSDFRETILNRLKKIQHHSNIERYQYVKEINSLKTDYLQKKETLQDEWEKLKIASLIKTGRFVGISAMANEPLISLGLNLFSINLSWVEWLVRILASGLIISGNLATELKTLIPAYRKVKSHPLCFIDKLPNNNRI